MAIVAACEQGYGPTYSRSARYGDNATAATAIANNGASSTSVEAQRQKIYNHTSSESGRCRTARMPMAQGF